MIIQKFSVNQHPINHILSWIQGGEIAIPEIQRPFVWSSTKVRNFIDSLFKGYPTGYIIVWQNPSVRLKDGTKSKGKKILIDGQQRITSLMTALLGKEVVNKNYEKQRVIISFNPKENVFEVANSIIFRDKQWIPDISEIFSPDFSVLTKIEEYNYYNPDIPKEQILKALDALKSIMNIPIGIIELSSDISIEEVTEIFIRINSSGVTLNEADFAMSKIAVDDKYGGNLLRKAIDYFCHLAVKPENYSIIKDRDREFVQSEYFPKMVWLKDDKDDLYDPSYSDVLRVAFTSKFERGRLQDLVALLSGRDFETKENREEIVESTFKTLKDGVLDIINETNFKRLTMIIRSAGFVDNFLISSQSAVDFAYVLFLKLKQHNFPPFIIESTVRKWFVMSTLKGRYSSSSETAFHYDIIRMKNNPLEYINNALREELPNSFWDITLVQELDKSTPTIPEFKVFLAAQVKMKDKGFLSRDITVEDLIKIKGDLHHIFPVNYLKKNGFVSRSQYNQVANFAYAQSEINIAISNKSPLVYFNILKEQCQTKIPKIGGIIDFEMLISNLEANCIPVEILKSDELLNDYEAFLEERRKLIAKKIKEYFKIL
ncbi:MAG: DUF262 domain-containing protein [Candidatus Kapaibacteriota bacterium]